MGSGRRTKASFCAEPTIEMWGVGGVSGGSSPNFYTVSGVGDACLVAPIGLVACGQGSGARPPLCHAGGRCSDHSGGGRTGTLSPRGGFSNEPTPLCDNSSAQIN